MRRQAARLDVKLVEWRRDLEATTDPRVRVQLGESIARTKRYRDAVAARAVGRRLRTDPRLTEEEMTR